MNHEGVWGKGTVGTARAKAKWGVCLMCLWTHEVVDGRLWSGGGAEWERRVAVGGVRLGAAGGF